MISRRGFLCAMPAAVGAAALIGREQPRLQLPPQADEWSHIPKMFVCKDYGDVFVECQILDLHNFWRMQEVEITVRDLRVIGLQRRDDGQEAWYDGATRESALIHDRAKAGDPRCHFGIECRAIVDGFQGYGPGPKSGARRFFLDWFTDRDEAMKLLFGLRRCKLGGAPRTVRGARVYCPFITPL